MGAEVDECTGMHLSMVYVLHHAMSVEHQR